MKMGLKPVLAEALASYSLSLADDELILAHRDSEWTGHAPILEEDIAFSNIAQDELGHAWLWYNLSCKFSGDDPDRLVFFRSAKEYQNVQMVELPNGDWAFSILRQYLFDAYELEHLTHLIGRSFQPISEIAAKIRTEELYHLRHTSNWIRRLGLGTEESNRRTQLALDSLWPFTGQLFELSPAQEPLIDEGMLPDTELLRSRWTDSVGTFLRQSELIIPSETPISSPRNKHTVHLAELLEEMQQVARLDPVARW